MKTTAHYESIGKNAEELLKDWRAIWTAVLADNGKQVSRLIDMHARKIAHMGGEKYESVREKLLARIFRDASYAQEYLDRIEASGVR